MASMLGGLGEAVDDLLGVERVSGRDGVSDELQGVGLGALAVQGVQAFVAVAAVEDLVVEACSDSALLSWPPIAPRWSGSRGRSGY